MRNLLDESLDFDVTEDRPKSRRFSSEATTVTSANRQNETLSSTTGKKKPRAPQPATWLDLNDHDSTSMHSEKMMTGINDVGAATFWYETLRRTHQNRYDTLVTKVKSLLDPLAPCKFSHPVWIKTSMLSSPMRLLLVKARGLNSQEPSHHKLAVSARAPLYSLPPCLFFGRCC